MSEMGPSGTPPSSSNCRKRLCQQYYYLVGLPVVGGGPGSHFRLLVVHTMFIHTCDLAFQNIDNLNMFLVTPRQVRIFPINLLFDDACYFNFNYVCVV